MRATAAATGRPGDDPGDLWRLSRYGSLHRIRSSRRLEQAAARNLALMWRLGKRRPDFKTIADVRRDHGTAMKRVCREFTLLGKALALFGGEVIAMDGGKLQAVNGKKRHVSGSKRGRLIEELDAQSEASLQQLDRQDAEDTPRRTPTAAQMQQQLEPWQERKPRYQRYPQQLQQSGDRAMSRTDPDRRQITRGDSSLVGDNVHVAVDEQYTLSVEHAVTHAVTDQHQLVPIAERAQQIVGAEPLEVVADLGYDDGAEVQQGEAQGWTVYSPNPQTSANPKLGLFGQERFTYNPAQDV